LNSLGSDHCLTRVICQLPGTAHRIEIGHLARLAAVSPSLLGAIVRHAQVTGAQVEQSVACNVLHSVEQRLARWLLMSRDRTDQDPLGLTQEFLALMLGVQRTSITAGARKLYEDGVISYRRGRISIVDRPALEALACECYADHRAAQSALMSVDRPDDGPASRWASQPQALHEVHAT
jgi:hypothetical protein